MQPIQTTNGALYLVSALLSALMKVEQPVPDALRQMRLAVAVDRELAPVRALMAACEGDEARMQALLDEPAELSAPRLRYADLELIPDLRLAPARMLALAPFFESDADGAP